MMKVRFLSLIQSAVCLVIPAMLILSASQAFCQPVSNEYVPTNLYDGFKSITQGRCVHQMTGQPDSNTSMTNYGWIDGKQWVSGVNCWRTCNSSLGFYLDQSTTVKSTCTYSSLVGSEYRYYGSDTVFKSGDTSKIRYDPYDILWKYGLYIGGQFTQSYKSISDYQSSTNPDSHSEQTVTDTIRLLGYETITTPFGTNSNCLKWERQSTVSIPSSSGTQTISNKTTFWYALNKGTVKYYAEGEGWKTTCYWDPQIVSTPPAPTDSDKDGITDNGDNCPYVSNPDQSDSDADGRGNACDGCPYDRNKFHPGVCGCGNPDIDSDGDGIFDCNDAFPYNRAEWIDTDTDGIGNNADPDDDNDGMPDTWEIEHGLNPIINDAGQDSDGDGFTNLEEYQNNTDPKSAKSYPGAIKPMPFLLLLLED